MYTAKPTKSQLAWQDMELGVIIHYVADIYNPDFAGYKTSAVRTELDPRNFHPKNLDVDQWIRSAKEFGAKYAVLVANHCTGFSLWPTKANDYSVKSMDWKDGKGDICRDFIEACKKYDVRPGLYYSTGCNGYYDINDSEKQDYQSEKYQEYVKIVESQVKELWTEYGELFEIWFDGGVISPEKGGPDLTPILRKYQPRAICFQGPRDFANNVRWVGNEDGKTPENCWSTTNAGEARYDGTVPDEKAGVGDPDGKYYWPAETDMPNRSHKGWGGGWGWREGEEDTVLSPEYLLDCYVHSVGRNSNLLLGMGISTDGDFKDEEQFIAFGKLIRDTFSTPSAILETPQKPNDNTYELTFTEPKEIRYIVIRENITEGQQIREFSVSVDGTEVCHSCCIGHKRIIDLKKKTSVNNLRLTILKDTGTHGLRDIALY